jgi:23S rRNA (cytosine1962-C5)-methyltransferase
MSDEYELIDSGLGRKAERLGPYWIERQAPVAVWRRTRPDLWKGFDAVHVRSQSGGGHWEFKKKFPDFFWIQLRGLKLKVKLTSFGHLGFFAEQASEWDYFRRVIPVLRSRLGRAPKLMNLFAYTGASTLAAAEGGAEITHVDAAKGVVDWARENATENKISGARFLVDGALEFVERELRRKNQYDGVILDPPSFGRTPKGRAFHIEEDLPVLLDALKALTPGGYSFLHFSCHTPGWVGRVLETLSLPLLNDELRSALSGSERPSGQDRGDLLIPSADSPALVSGAYFRACLGEP